MMNYRSHVLMNINIKPKQKLCKQFFPLILQIQLTKSRSNLSDGSGDNAIIVPIFYNPENGKVTSLHEVSNDSSNTLSPHDTAVIAYLREWNETVPRAPGL